LPIKRADDVFLFPWFIKTEDEDTLAAYAALIRHICELTKRQTRAVLKESPCENPKLKKCGVSRSLRHTGAEYKAARKILTSRLPGDGRQCGTETSTKVFA
jgi:hypothetical protein